MGKEIVAILVMASLLSIAGVAMADDQSSWEHSSSTITVTVVSGMPVINWYDFRNSTEVSKLNAEIDVGYGDEYHFMVNITDINNWDDIAYINITAWYDDGDDSADNYVASNPNLNMKLQYNGASDTFSMVYPTTGEAVLGPTSCVDTTINTTTHNLTFYFTPEKQIRHTPLDTFTGTTGWDDSRSWNFNISVVDGDGNKYWEHDEYGIYMYTLISLVGSPSMSGAPGAEPSDTIQIVTASNGNYSLYVNVPDLTGPDTIDNTSVSVAGGVLPKTPFNDIDPLYIYGTGSSYKAHETSGATKTTDVTYYCLIPTVPSGAYTATITYKLKTQNA